MQLPAKNIKKPAGLRRTRVVEMPSIKVFWESSIALTFIACLGQVYTKYGQPILKGLQCETAEDKPDAERAEASLGKIVSIVFDVRIDRRTNTRDDACHQAHPNRK